MTREEAIAILNKNRPKILWEDKETQERMAGLCKALDVAIISLEAWDKVYAEIEDLNKPFVVAGYRGGLKDALKIIEKHMDGAL